MKKGNFHPEARLMRQANKTDCEVFVVTALEIDPEDGKFYVHTGEYADAVDPKRLAVVPQDVPNGSKAPLFYPGKSQIICETEEAEIRFRKMLVEAALADGKEIGKEITGAYGEAGFIAFVSDKEPTSNLAAHRFTDRTMVECGQADR